MAIGRSEDRDNPWDAMVLLRHHCRVWDPIRAPHLGQRPSVPHTKILWSETGVELARLCVL